MDKIKKTVVYDKNGKLRTIHYECNNLLHNLNGPAQIVFDLQGKRLVKYYYHYGKLHNSKGPAYVFYGTKSIVHKYYLHDRPIKVSSKEEFKKYKKLLILD